MKVFLKTSLSPEMELYDTSGAGAIGGEGSIIQSILNPVVIVRDNEGNDLYVYGQYQASSIGSFLILSVAFFLILKILK
jgi:hypothetical protein